MDADTNGGPIGEKEPPVVQEVRTSGAGKAELHEPALNLSPLREDRSVRVDDSWLDNGLRTSKTQKDKKIARLNNGGPLFGRRVDHVSMDQPDQHD